MQKLCRHALWLEHGRPRLYGDADHVAREYLAWHEARTAAAAKAAKAPPPASAYVVTDVALTIEGGGDEIDAARGFRVDVEVRSPDDREPVLAVGVVRADGTPVYGTTSEIDGAAPVRHRSVALRVLGALRGPCASSGALPPSRARDGSGRSAALRHA